MEQEKFEQLVNYVTNQVIEQLLKSKFRHIGKMSENFSIDQLQTKLSRSSQKADTIYIVHQFSLNNLANISRLVSTDDDEEQIINALLKGQEIYILREGVAYRENRNTSGYGVRRQINIYEDTLIRLGIRFINASSQNQQTRDLNCIRYLTVADLKKVQKYNSELSIGTDVKITECAQEWADEHHILIKRCLKRRD